MFMSQMLSSLYAYLVYVPRYKKLSYWPLQLGHWHISLDFYLFIFNAQENKII